MRNARTIIPGHPLFTELRNGLLWHCTSPQAFRQITADGFLKPVEGNASRWGSRPYACQTLGAICLFDFTSESEERVLDTANRWQQFVGAERPATVILGMEGGRLPGRLVRYPETRDATPRNSGGPIPWVEVCHVGRIPVSAIAKHVLVYPVDYGVFRVCCNLDERTLLSIEREFAELLAEADRAAAERNAEMEARVASPEFQALLAEAKRRAREMGAY